MMSKNASRERATSPELARIEQVRTLVASAQLERPGVRNMLLRLTARDASILKRHPGVAVHEITFAKGEMRFLGVRVQEGGVTASVLEHKARPKAVAASRVARVAPTPPPAA